MRDPLHISLYAASSARRNWLSALARKHFAHEAIKVVRNLGSFHHATNDAAEVLIVDVGSSAEAAALIRFLQHSPGAFGSVALIDVPEPAWLGAALAAGVNAISSREPNSEEFRLSVAAAEAGLVLLHPAAARNLVGATPHPFPSGEPEELGELEELTPREREVLRLMSAGLGNKQIAARLAISEHTAKFHISSILGKLSVGSRTEAVTQGIKRGLIPI